MSRAQAGDWKSFWIKNKWAPSSLVRSTFGLKPHDVDNWRRKPEVRMIMDAENWRLGGDIDAVSARRILEPAWRYYTEEVRGLSFEKAAVAEIIALSNVGKPSRVCQDVESWSFLVSGKYLSRLALGYERWIARGLTTTAFNMFHLHPGSERMQELGVLPFMFLHTHASALGKADADALFEHIYMNIYMGCGAEASHQDAVDAMEEFIARRNEPQFFPSSFVREHGYSTQFPDNHRDLSERLARKYMVELDHLPSGDTAFSAGRFRRENPDVELDRCAYCSMAPVDLHHLLPRSEYPEHAMDVENVVPLCVQVHAAISRGKWTDEGRGYAAAIKAWRSSPPGSRARAFDSVMADLHEEIGLNVQAQVDERP